MILSEARRKLNFEIKGEENRQKAEINLIKMSSQLYLVVAGLLCGQYGHTAEEESEWELAAELSNLNCLI